MLNELNPDDLPAAWGVPLDESPEPEPIELTEETPATGTEAPFLLEFRDADAPPPEGFVPKLRLGDAA